MVQVIDQIVAALEPLLSSGQLPAGDVVQVHMGGHGRHALAEQVARRFVQAAQAQAAVHHQVKVAAADVPDVAAQQGNDVRLGDEGDAVAQGAHLEPLALNRLEHGVCLGAAPGGWRPHAPSKLRASDGHGPVAGGGHRVGEVRRPARR